MILINLIEGNLWIFDFHSPFCQSWNSTLKLLKIDSSIIAGINGIEELPIDVVLLEI